MFKRTLILDVLANFNASAKYQTMKFEIGIAVFVFYNFFPFRMAVINNKYLFLTAPCNWTLNRPTNVTQICVHMCEFFVYFSRLYVFLCV